MIETLDGLHETVNYRKESLIKFHDNTDYENYPLHWHNSIEIIMPVMNSYAVICNHVTYNLRQGDILVIQPNVLHQMPAVRGRRFICQASLLPIYSLSMYRSMFALLPSTLLIVPEQEENLHARIQEQLNAIYHDYESTNQTAEMSMYVSILQILMLIGKSLGEKNIYDNDFEHQNQTHNILAIFDYINNHYAEKLTLEEVARISGYSKFHFDRLFKRYANETFYQYLNKIRIRNVELLLRDCNVSITEAAYRSGFSTISSFIRMFKIHNKCTPSEYRNIYEINRIDSL